MEQPYYQSLTIHTVKHEQNTTLTTNSDYRKEQRLCLIRINGLESGKGKRKGNKQRRYKILLCMGGQGYPTPSQTPTPLSTGNPFQHTHIYNTHCRIIDARFKRFQLKRMNR